MTRHGPLADLLVVDLTRVLAGPFAAMMLADLGARVIKVEKPDGGDDSRTYGPHVGGESAYYARVNRGKESIVLDLTAAADKAVLLGLVERADVLVENFRPGVMARLGLSYELLAARNPRLVYASVSGFGQTGPWSHRPAYDAVVQGLSGLMSITGSADGPSVKPGIPVADLAGGLYCFGAIMAALHGRSRTGLGSRVDVAMFDSVLSLLESAALGYLATGEVPGRIGNAHYSIAPFDTFRCSDGEITICAAHDGLFGLLCAAIDRPDLVASELYLRNVDRHTNRATLKAEIETTLAPGSCEGWLARLGAVGVPCGPVQDVAAALGSEQTIARGMVVNAGGVPMPGNPMRIEGYEFVPAAAPRLDEHGAAIRAELAP